MEAGAGQAGEDVAGDWRRRRNNLRRDSPDTRASRNVACGDGRQRKQGVRVCACRGAERGQRTVSLVSEGGQRLGGRPIGD
jgi:hypothetical protein